ncbi:MAG: hypothetical protein SF028_12940 [Candidatus Sumerlaeia bacterium]|nr:hypothetical protein [Candidatus Sumerlaeia bacterium]
MTGFLFVAAALYLTLAISFVLALPQAGDRRQLARATMVLWGKFLAGLGGVAAVVGLLDLFS